MTGFLMLDLDLIDQLGGSWEAAGVAGWIRFKAGEDGWWTATRAEIAADTRLPSGKLRRALQELRDAGLLESERVGPYDATQRWRVTKDAGETVSAESATSGGAVLATSESAEIASSPLSKNLEEQPGAERTEDPGPGLSLVADSDALFPSDEVEKPATERTAEDKLNVCRTTYLREYYAQHGRPDPTRKRQALGRIKQLAKDRETEEDWLRLLDACTQAGQKGQFDVGKYLGPPPVSHFPSRTNHHLAAAEAAAQAGLLGDMLGGWDPVNHRPAIGGTA